MYTILFLARHFPFWALPVALLCFEMGYYYYRKRERFLFVSCFFLAASLFLTSVFWVVFEGYWRAGPWIKGLIDPFVS